MDRHCVAVLSVFLFALTTTHCRTFEPVEFARTLHQLQVSDWDIPTFVCLAHNASQLNTNSSSVMRLQPLRRNVTFYGIFGVPEVWLSSCALTAEQLMDDDVSDDVKCVHQELTLRLSFFDRTDNLGALTPHIVDLDKCFNWWEKLPPFINWHEAGAKPFAETGTKPPPVCPPVETRTHSPTDALSPLAPKLSDIFDTLRDKLNQTEHQAPSVCQCTADSRSAIVEISLIFLNLILLALCYLLWATFVRRRRTIDSEALQFVNPHNSSSM